MHACDRSHSILWNNTVENHLKKKHNKTVAWTWGSDTNVKGTQDGRIYCSHVSLVLNQYLLGLRLIFWVYAYFKK